MSIRGKLLDFKRRLSDKKMYSIVIVVTALVATVGIYQYKRALDFQNFVNNQYNRSFHEMVGYVENVEVSLAKAMLVTTPAQMEFIASETWRKAAFAQANLGQLPISHLQIEKTSRFLNQVGEYTYSLARKVMNGEEVSDEDYKQLEEMQKYANVLSNGLNELQGELYSGTFRFGDLRKEGNRHFAKASKNIVVNGVQNIEKEFRDYPALIYDGPFADHIERREPRLLKGEKEITREDAQKIAAQFLGKERAQNIEYKGEGNGRIHTYLFTAGEEGNNGRRVSINITKQGGHVLWMLDNRNIEKISMNMEQVEEKAQAFLTDRGLNNMKQSYYLQSAGVVTVNYAYTENDIVMYTDLVKVKVAMDNGEILGYEAEGYIMNHDPNRNLPLINITEEEAQEKINPNLEINSVRLTVIPLESQREVLCYEFKGSFNDKEFLIYINAENGREEKILLLKETPNGVLTL